MTSERKKNTVEPVSRAEPSLVEMFSLGKVEKYQKKGQVKGRWSCDWCQDEFNDTYNKQRHHTGSFFFFFISTIYIHTHAPKYAHTDCWMGQKRRAVFYKVKPLGNFVPCRFTYFWSTKLHCLVLSCSPLHCSKWKRNSLGCRPGKKYFVICQWNNLAHLKDIPAGRFSLSLFLVLGVFL